MTPPPLTFMPEISKDKRPQQLLRPPLQNPLTRWAREDMTTCTRHMYLGLHFPSSGNDEGVAPILPHLNAPTHGLSFPQRVAQLLVSLEPGGKNRALDIGCAVGGSSFELAHTFDHVDAFDFSQSFVDAAKRMQAGENIRFKIPVEADLYEEVDARHQPGMTPAKISKIKFFQGDACDLGGMVEDGRLSNEPYDGIVMANLLCRLPEPMACLDGLSNLVNKDGVVVMVTPFSWLAEFTPRSKWLGGFYDHVSKEPIRSKDVLKDLMEHRGFEKIHEEEMPLVIREHQRKYQYIVSEATAWRKMK
jgi:putative 4-mercaptohistidine N1-methyltranferase